MKLPKFKNPLQAAADFAQRMAGEEVSSPQAERPVERPAARPVPPPVYEEPAPRYEEPAPVYREEAPVYEEQPPVVRPTPQPKKKAPRRKATPLEDIGYTIWALCIAVSVAATALAFLIGAIS